LGTGEFKELAVVINNNGEGSNLDTIFLGDRVAINFLEIKDNKIIIEMLTHDIYDPYCCPSKKLKVIYKLVGNKLEKVSSPPLE